MKDVFHEIRAKFTEIEEHRQDLRKQKEKKNIFVDRRKERVKKLKSLAKEFYGLLQDQRYPGYSDFLKELKEGLNNSLKNVQLKGKTVSDQAMERVLLAGQIRLLETIIEYPSLVMKELEDLGIDLDKI